MAMRVKMAVFLRALHAHALGVHVDCRWLLSWTAACSHTLH